MPKEIAVVLPFNTEADAQTALEEIERLTFHSGKVRKAYEFKAWQVLAGGGLFLAAAVVLSVVI